MRSQYSLCYIATIFILSLPIKVECCSLTTYDIIMLMSRNPNYAQDPCYIQWNAIENQKLTDIWAKREKLEESIRQSNLRQMEYDARVRENRERENREREYRERENRQRMNEISSKTKKGNGSVLTYLTIVGVILGLICFAVCVSAAQKDDENDTVRNRSYTNLHRNENPTSQLTSIVTSNVSVNQTISPSNDNHSREENVTRIPLNAPRRQNSLPSYEDAVKMPSAPVVE